MKKSRKTLIDFYIWICENEHNVFDYEMPIVEAQVDKFINEKKESNSKKHRLYVVGNYAVYTGSHPSFFEHDGVNWNRVDDHIYRITDIKEIEEKIKRL